MALRGRTLLVWVVCSVLWSGNWLVIRFGLADLPPLRFAGLRLVIASLLLAAIVFAGRKALWTPGQRRFVALAGFLQLGVSYACVYQALRFINSGLAAVLFATFALWVGVLAHVLLDEPLTPRTTAGILLGLAGVAVIQGPALAEAVGGRPGPLAVGGLLMMVSAFVSAFAVIVIKKHLAGVSAFANTLGQSVVGVVVLLIASAILEREIPSRFTPASLASLAYLGIVGTLVFAGTQWLVPRVPAAVMGSFPLVTSALAVVWGGLFGSEILSARAAAGGALILAGVAIVVLAPSPRRAP